MVYRKDIEMSDNKKALKFFRQGETKMSAEELVRRKLKHAKER